MLLILPPELIQLVLQSVSTPDYLQVAYSCHILYEIASTCREVVLHHLYQTPGLVSGVQELETKTLFQLLVRRSHQQLYGAQFYARRKTIEFESQVIDAQASSLASSSRDPNLALVFKDQPDIFLFRAENGGFLSPRARLRLPWEEPGAVELLKTTSPGEDGVYALYRFTPTMDGNDPNAEHPFIQHALQSNPSGTVHLVHFASRSLQPHVRVCAFPNHAGYKALAIAVADSNKFAISWQHEREDHDHEVVIYSIYDESPDETSEVIELRYHSGVSVNERSHFSDSNQSLEARLGADHMLYKHGPARDLVFNDRSSQILYYYRAQTLYGSFQGVETGSLSRFPRLHRNSCVVPFSDAMSLHFAIDIPFFGTHSTQRQNGIDMCNWKYLSLGIATHRREDWTIACLLTSEAHCQSRNCGHILNLDRGRRFTEWTVVGKLAGFQNSTSSLGCITAMSPGGTRIAVSNWNVIYIWALEPNSLIEDNADGFYPPALESASSGMIELQPAILPLEAVCFKLRFLDKEDELLAFTDRGVVHWDLGPLARGEREVTRLTV